MNGNELNNMAQRYKDEMMRLYKKAELPTMQSARLAVRASPLLRNVSRHRHSKIPRLCRLSRLRTAIRHHILSPVPLLKAVQGICRELPCRMYLRKLFRLGKSEFSGYSQYPRFLRMPLSHGGEHHKQHCPNACYAAYHSRG